MGLVTAALVLLLLVEGVEERVALGAGAAALVLAPCVGALCVVLAAGALVRAELEEDEDEEEEELLLACAERVSSCFAFCWELATAPRAFSTSLARPVTPGAEGLEDDDAPLPAAGALVDACAEEAAEEEGALEDEGVETGVGGVLAVVVDELPWSANSHTPASTTMPRNAIWKGREMFAIAASFGISRPEVERLLDRWTQAPGKQRAQSA
ncbi:MAG TPA: hypothetical protein VFW29_00610 [Solirubrobacteraceae bacterium]|nr:hypothetical protein [Solirubrobacteraceae bacterium]